MDMFYIYEINSFQVYDSMTFNNSTKWHNNYDKSVLEHFHTFPNNMPHTDL